jgi:hypothetical protein
MTKIVQGCRGAIQGESTSLVNKKGPQRRCVGDPYEFGSFVRFVPLFERG